METANDEGPNLEPWHNAEVTLDEVIRRYHHINADGSPLRCWQLSVAITNLETAFLWQRDGLRDFEDGNY